MFVCALPTQILKLQKTQINKEQTRDPRDTKEVLNQEGIEPHPGPSFKQNQNDRHRAPKKVSEANRGHEAMCALLEPPEVSARPWLSVPPLAYPNIVDVNEEKDGRKDQHHPRQDPKKVSEASKEQDTVCTLLGPPDHGGPKKVPKERKSEMEKEQKKSQQDHHRDPKKVSEEDNERDHHRGQKKVSDIKAAEDVKERTESQPYPHRDLKKAPEADNEQDIATTLLRRQTMTNQRPTASKLITEVTRLKKDKRPQKREKLVLVLPFCGKT